MITSCKCGNWYNTSVKCPQCGTVAQEEPYSVDDNEDEE